ncbi:MAG TPA: DUF5985 family protein [Xanthomonadaceae bacterium]|nr:DUF5985 family protein [Xanthomonadaceae bacterium]
MNQFMLGAIAMGSAVAALLFFRYWRSSHDRLFLYFSLSFATEAFDRLLMALGRLDDSSTVFYLIRLLSYALILWAVIEKNLSGRSRP